MLLGMFPDPVVAGEERVFELVVSTKLAPGEVITNVTATVDCFNPPTFDPNPDGLVLDPPAIVSPNGVVAQRLGSAWVAPGVYELIFVVSTNANNVRVFSSLIRCDPLLNSQALNLSGAAAAAHANF